HHTARVVNQSQRPIESGVAATANNDILIGERTWILHAVVQILPFDFLGARHVELTRLEGTHTGCNHDRPGIEDSPSARYDTEASVLLALHFRDLLTEVHSRLERLDLLEQAICELLAGADGHRGDVVNRLVRIELSTLPAGDLERVDDMSFEAQQSQLEHLEQSARARTDDDDVGLDRMSLELKRGGVWSRRGHEASPW